VPLTPLDLLASVEAAFFSSHRGALYRLAIHYASTGLRISFQANPQAFTDSPVDLFPGSVDAPFPEVPLNGGPSRKVVRQQAPLAAAFQEVEDGVQDLTKAVGPRPSTSFGGGQVGLYVVPFGVG
jgi:hypothetical protein